MVVASLHLTTVAIAESELSYLRVQLAPAAYWPRQGHGPHGNAEEWSGLNSRDRQFYSRRQDGAAIGNILLETSVHNLSAETSHQKELWKNQMKIVKTTAAALMSSLLIGAACMPAWSATGATPAPISADVMLAKNVTGSLPAPRSWLVPSAVDTTQGQEQTNCKARHLYSQHDIVGDPQACIMGALTIGGSSTAVAP
jgi:hypothetical protein